MVVVVAGCPQLELWQLELQDKPQSLLASAFFRKPPTTTTTPMRVPSLLLATVVATIHPIGSSAFAPSSPLTRSNVASSSSTVSFAPSITQHIHVPSSSLRTSSSRSNTRLFMGWGPDPIWSTGTVEGNVIQACPSGSCVSIKIGVEDGTGFLYPGQYVQVEEDNLGCRYYELVCQDVSMEML
eukprot:scaffold530_cov193-Alexandrium_tamarense.AAC.24